MNTSDSASSRQKILVLTFTPIKSEPRALKQIRFLSQTYDVTSAGFGPAPFPEVPHIELDPHPKTRSFMQWPLVKAALYVAHSYTLLASRDPRIADARERLSHTKWDIIIAHDVLTVPLARSLNPRIGVLADLHEYAPRQDEHSKFFRYLIAPYFNWILRTHVTKCLEVTTVSQGIVDEYARVFGISSTLVVNATPYREFTPTPTAAPIKLVHSGIPAPHRKLEVMIDAVRKTKANVTLDLFLMEDNSSYLEHLRHRAADDPRIQFRKPVAYTELIDTLHNYDVGLTLIAPTTFNLAWCLPNKFFDFVQARLAVISGPSPEMAAFIHRYNFGIVTKDFSADSLQSVLEALTPERVNKLKSAADTHADELSGEHQSQVWGDVVERMINQNP